MDPFKRGDLSESRFFQAAKRLARENPALIERVRRSSPSLDARGIDSIIRLRYPKGSVKDGMSVPCEVKSSKAGVSKWRVTHPEHHRAGVLVFYFRDDIPNAAYRALILRALKTVRKRSPDGTLYHSWFQRLFVRQLSPRGRRNVRLIKERRAKTVGKEKQK